MQQQRVADRWRLRVPLNVSSGAKFASNSASRVHRALTTSANNFYRTLATPLTVLCVFYVLQVGGTKMVAGGAAAGSV